MKKLLKLYASLLLALFSLSVIGWSQETKTLNLDEAIQLALKHSKQLKLDSLQIKIAENKVEQAKNGIIPKLALDLNYLRISNNITPTKISFPSGDFTLNPQILNQSFNSLQLKQLIFSGGKIKYGIEIAQKDIESSRFDSQKNRIDVEYTIAALWYNLALLKSSKKIIEVNITDLEAKKKDIINYVVQGLAIKNDALKLDLAVTNLQSNLNDINTSISSINYNLCTFTGLPTSNIIELPESISEETPINNIDVYLNDAIINRPELKGLKTRMDGANTKSITQAQENYRVEKNKLDATSTTPTDFLDANTKLLQAQLNLNSAFLSSQLAYKE